MLLYLLAKIIMTPALACYFRKRSFLGAEKIPARGPVVVIANHAASFLDAVVMGVMLKRPIHFFTRGDVFRKKWVKYLLDKLHMIPIYSADLAKNDLHRNIDSFGAGVEVLRKGGLLLIFPEGSSRLERNVLPLKKGVSRIILQAVDSDEQSIVKVIPIGIHYSKHAFRSDLQMVAGDPLNATAFREEYRINPSRTINRLTETLDGIFRKVVLFVNQDERSGLIEQQLEMLSNEKNGRFNWDQFYIQKTLCEQVSSMDDVYAEEQKQLQDSYFARLNFLELQDNCFTDHGRRKVPFLLLIVLFPVFFVGVMLNILPYLLGKYIADNKVTRADFYTSVLVAVSAFSYVIWLLIWLVVSVLTNNDLLLIVFAVSPILSWIALWWMDEFRNWKFQNRYNTLLAAEPDEISKLISLRSQVVIKHREGLDAEKAV